MQMYDSKKIRVRFAPSPTGNLHIGGLRSALFNWLFARHNNATYLLRIEDTDIERSTSEFKKAILDAFDWVNIHPDEPIVIQSERINEHKKVIQLLLEQGKAYRCFCTQDEIVSRLDKKKDGDLFAHYDRYCLARKYDQSDLQKPHVVRFKMPEDISTILFDDLIRGPVSFDSVQFDDFIIVRTDGWPVYNLVVVIDDVFMGITHVIRGEEHIPNTPKQILLYKACGYPVPQFGHLPMILGPDGSKLSKRDGATSVMDYKSAGYLPDALINYLVRLGWSHGDQEIFSRQELINYFSLDHVGKKGSIFDIEKLDWINSVYIKNSTNQDILEHIVNSVDTAFLEKVVDWSSDTIMSAIALYKDRVKTLKELVDELLLFYEGPSCYDSSDLKTWITPESSLLLREIIILLQSNKSIHSDDLKNELKKFTKDRGIKLVEIAQPFRIALVGSASGASLFGLLELISVEKIIARLRKLLEISSA